MELMSAIFDMDGVITDTAQVHFKAWKKIFDHYLEDNAKQRNISFEPFTIDDYIRYVDGLSRIDGIKYFLQSRKLIESADTLNPSEEQLIEKIAEVKNQFFLQLIEKEGVSVFKSTIDLVKELRKNNIKTAVISSSKNCRDILTQADVIHLFDAVVDGKALQLCNLKGKPDPAIFLEAAKRIEATPSKTVVIEDALSGIIAGKAGKFGLVIGIDRQKKWAAQFEQQGADIVVNDLSELPLSRIRERFIKYPPLASDNYAAIEKKLEGKRIILFCDYDGTLTPIVKRPELAKLSNDIKDIFLKLQNYFPIAIISGRELSDLETMVGLNGLYYAGNHGLEIIGPSHFATKFERGLEFSDAVQAAYLDLVRDLATFDNVLIENKKLSLSVHYRLVDEKYVPEIEQIVDDVLKRQPTLIKHYGKKVFELRPNLNWNKGKALKWIMEQLDYKGKDVLPIYLGDDVTDEDVFYTIKKIGIGILISDEVKKTHAHYRLHNPRDVYHFFNTIFANLLDTNLSSEHTWNLTYNDYEPERETLREALCTLGNGYFATRGASEESQADDIHYPGTYFAGCYNRVKSIIGGKDIYNEDLVNMPNWLPLTFKIEEGPWFSFADFKVLSYYQNLNLKQGVLTRKLKVEDNEGRITHLEYTRFVSMANSHLACQKFHLKAENWAGRVTLKSGLDGSIKNSGVARYRDLNQDHLKTLKVKGYKNGKISLLVRTHQSHIEVAYTAHHRFYKDNLLQDLPDFIETNSATVYCYFTTFINPQESLVLEKFVTVATNKDAASSDSLTDTKNMMRLIKKEKFESLLKAHQLAWNTLWRRCEFKIVSEGDDQLILHLHIFHLLQTVSKNSVDLDIGVPARGLHGESYRGHIFWDELFIMPFYTFYFPEMARSLLLYRYRRLNMARLLARNSGYKGAMYPWQSASNGDEVTQPIHLNPRSNEWLPDYSHYQRHVNAAIVYNIWRYYLVTNDKNFLADYGAEMILEIARFWSSIATYNEIEARYEIKNIVGPDEYHEKYPQSDYHGVNNNAYTNIMAVWSVERALEILTLLSPSRSKELQELLHIDNIELARWNEITTKMKVPFHDDVIISQFEGYEILPEFEWEYYKEKYGNIERLDRILKAENDSPDNYKVSKQADVLMLFYLFTSEELATIFAKLGYSFNDEILIKNIFYYLERTSHGSTLSKVVLASLAKYIEQDIALKFYQDVLNSDIMDTQGGTTPEGIHLGAMASCLNIALMCFAGMEIKNNTLSFTPQLPMRVQSLQFNLQYHQQWLKVLVEKGGIKIELDPESKNPLPVLINEALQVIKPSLLSEVDESLTEGERL
ncbi:MAG: trehalose-phosphatase [Gammaproteobacteria bacterium]|nr:trehalose-phosphatase [Gammaproteobacteria bacterium]